MNPFETLLKRKDYIPNQICVICEGDAKTFNDELSEREYKISGMCQKCQDRIFGD